MKRPELSALLSELEFQHWYWLKVELQAFCRTQGLSAAGGKVQLSNRIAAFLSSRPHAELVSLRRKSAAMPTTFTLGSIIGEGWRCSQTLRHFFESHVGEGFSFNEPLRRFVKERAGSTLADALAHYRHSLAAGPQPIASQFEYNTHMREYRRRHPASTHAEAVSAWWEKRNKRAP